MKLFQLIPSKHTRKQHWEHVYKKNKPDELGWYQDYPEMSLKLITATGVGVDGNIIDVGGGISKLAGILIDQGYMRLTVLDISGSSIERAKLQYGEKSKQITWIEAYVTNFNFSESFDIWHDRAVFHFLTDANERRRYVDLLNQALKPGGHLIILTFGLKGPPKCNGLNVVRYSAVSLHKEFGDQTFSPNGISDDDLLSFINFYPMGESERFICKTFKSETIRQRSLVDLKP